MLQQYDESERIDEYYQKRITPDELRKFDGYETISDEEAIIEIDNLIKLARLLYHHITRKNSYKEYKK